ncbi:MAG: TIGR03943 family protein [Patescibacteria group bacterium]
MRFKWLTDYWQGLILAVSSIIASLWLGLTGKLTLYIHPRYVIFTMVMSGLSLIIIMAGLWLHPYKRAFLRPKSLLSISMGLVCLLLCVSLLVTKPSALTSSTASQRGINTGALDLASQSSITTQLPSNVDYSQFTVKEWASLLSQTTDPSFFEGKKTDITGFISPADNNPNVFFASRFILTCCAVDARPIGVPVYYPNWRAAYNTDQWVRVDGSFTQNPDKGTPLNVIKPSAITKVNQPDDPYVH